MSAAAVRSGHFPICLNALLQMQQDYRDMDTPPYTPNCEHFASIGSAWALGEVDDWLDYK